MSYTAMIPLTELAPNPNQPRRDPDPAAAAELTESVRQYGILTPITVAANGSGFLILAGHRRYLAASAAGLQEIPAHVIETAGATHNLLVGLIENTQREDLPPIEEAVALKALRDRMETDAQEEVSLQELARTVNKPYERVRGMIKMLDLPPEILDLIASGDLNHNFRVVDALYRLPAEARVAFAQKAAREGLSGRGMERAVAKYLSYATANAGKSPGRYPDHTPAINPAGDVVDPETGETLETAEEIIEDAKTIKGKLPEGPKIPNVLKAAYGDGRAKVAGDPQGTIKATAVKACKACAFYGETFDRTNPAAVCVECPLTRFLVSYHEQNTKRIRS